MNCEDARLLIDAHLDRELDPATDRQMADHLRGCERCSKEADATRALRVAMNQSENRYQAPPALRARIENALREGAPPQGAKAARSGRSFRRITAVVVPAAMAAMLAVFLTVHMFQPGESDFLMREVVAAHVRSTQVDHLTDVASTDRHTVKPWFEGKLDFSPPVADFQADGFKLEGGRVDYLDDRAVAALVYRHGAHVINVFVWPAPVSEESAVLASRNGYNVDHFVHGNMDYWLVSDTSADEIQKLVALLEGKS